MLIYATYQNLDISCIFEIDFQKCEIEFCLCDIDLKMV